ncbi:uncharacterized protein SAPINGB_P003820 [Magnusiomyces paraingens]|uniref:DUF8040 domain-containing protein n=1 Tax=Magnusiomyces paraingens TaxID=2606893 RepID=A0A5E8BWQ1_9ASCO|nr:uncharacterized protein SAPINGB_P003820 [Saprochaete ingens]VVT53927.1 unnamed protein product [Saprochaete ingens]
MSEKIHNPVLDSVPGQKSKAHDIDAEINDLNHSIATAIMLLKTTLPDRLRSLSAPDALHDATSNKETHVAKYQRHLKDARNSIDPKDLVLSYVDTTIGYLDQKLDLFKRRHQLFANHNSYVHESPEFTHNPASHFIDSVSSLPEKDFFRLFRVKPSTFKVLVAWLQSNTSIQSGKEHILTPELKVALFLYIVGHNATYHQVHELFPLALSTIETAYHHVTECLLEVAPSLITPEDYSPGNMFDSYRSDPNFYPYFQNCVGTIITRYIKSPLKATKALYVLDLENRVVFLHLDADLDKPSLTIYQEAINSGKLVIPPGKYLLGPHNFRCTNGVLSPYLSVTPSRESHIEQESSPAFETERELFNHISEKFLEKRALFDTLLIHRFHILRAGALRQTTLDEDSLFTVILALNNIIHHYDLPLLQLGQWISEEEGIRTVEAAPVEKDTDGDAEMEDDESSIPVYEITEFAAPDAEYSLWALRKHIADTMWREYLAETA